MALLASPTSFHRTPCPSSPNLLFFSGSRRGRDNHLSIRRCNGSHYHTLTCSLTKLKEKETPSSSVPATLTTEPHKYFDQVVITVRSGDGGHGAVLSMPREKEGPKTQGRQPRNDKDKKKKRSSSFKRDSDGSLLLPLGGHGGDVVIYADESVDSLLELHKKKRHNAKRGGHVDAMGGLTSQLHDGIAAPTLRIPVPIGTVVRRKRGTFLADLVHPGDQIIIAKGGQGGISLLEMPERGGRKIMALTSNIMRDETDKVLVLGQPGEEVSLELILRVVADVGLVGLPNAGKSTLLAAITLAKPDIADYPFTTLMPNLGCLDGDPSLGPLQFSSKATLADLPGLIEGAHLGKGLGRNFLRHLRRTRLLVHVVDAASENPVDDYRTVKEELRMYNPSYLERPYIVVLNKVDLPEARDRLSTLTVEISQIGRINPVCSESTSEEENPLIANSETRDISLLESPNEERKEKNIEDYPRPLAVLGASVLKRTGVQEILNEIRAALRKC